MDFVELVVRYETRLWNRLDAGLRTRGEVSMAVLAALRVLAQHEGRGRVQDLRDDLDVTVGAASKLVDRLERDGLATRRPHPTDRRSSLVVLTPLGRKALAAATAVVDELLVAHLDGERDLTRVTAALERLTARLVEPAVTS